MSRSDEGGKHPVKHRLPPLIPRSLAPAGMSGRGLSLITWLLSDHARIASD